MRKKTDDQGAGDRPKFNKVGSLRQLLYHAAKRDTQLKEGERLWRDSF